MYFPTPEKQGLSYKLGTRWRGPFKIVSKVDKVTYRVRQEEGTKISTFPVHVQRLKRHKLMEVEHFKNEFTLLRFCWLALDHFG